MDVIVLASYIWLYCSCVCLLKIVTRRLPTAITHFSPGWQNLCSWLPFSAQQSLSGSLEKAPGPFEKWYVRTHRQLYLKTCLSIIKCFHFHKSVLAHRCKNVTSSLYKWMVFELCLWLQLEPLGYSFAGSCLHKDHSGEKTKRQIIFIVTCHQVCFIFFPQEEFRKHFSSNKICANSLSCGLILTFS